MTNKELALTICEKFQKEYFTKDIINIMIDIEDLLNNQSNLLNEEKEMYKECFEKYIPIDKWDEATEFISAYGNGLAKSLLKKEK